MIIRDLTSSLMSDLADVVVQAGDGAATRCSVEATPQQQQGAGASAQQAARAAVGRLSGGLLGGRQQQAEPTAAEIAPTQATLFSVTSEIRNVSSNALSPDLFAVPAGYREVQDGIWSAPGSQIRSASEKRGAGA